MYMKSVTHTIDKKNNTIFGVPVDKYFANFKKIESPLNIEFDDELYKDLFLCKEYPKDSLQYKLAIYLDKNFKERIYIDGSNEDKFPKAIKHVLNCLMPREDFIKHALKKWEDENVIRGTYSIIQDYNYSIDKSVCDKIGLYFRGAWSKSKLSKFKCSLDLFKTEYGFKASLNFKNDTVFATIPNNLFDLKDDVKLKANIETYFNALINTIIFRHIYNEDTKLYDHYIYRFVHVGWDKDRDNADIIDRFTELPEDIKEKTDVLITKYFDNFKKVKQPQLKLNVDLVSKQAPDSSK